MIEVVAELIWVENEISSISGSTTNKNREECSYVKRNDTTCIIV